MSTTNAKQKTPKSLNVFIYRQKSFAFSLMMAIGFCFYCMNPVHAIISFIVFGVFWDWYFFSYKKVRDTEETVKLHPRFSHQSADYWNKIAMKLVYVSRFAFVLGLIAEVTYYFITTDNDLFLIYFGLTYGIINIVGGYICSDKINNSTQFASKHFNNHPYGTSGNGSNTIPLPGQMPMSGYSSSPAFANTAYGVTGEIVPGYINNISTSSSFSSFSSPSFSSTPTISSFD